MLQTLHANALRSQPWPPIACPDEPMPLFSYVSMALLAVERLALHMDPACVMAYGGRCIVIQPLANAQRGPALSLSGRRSSGLRCTDLARAGGSRLAHLHRSASCACGPGPGPSEKLRARSYLSQLIWQRLPVPSPPALLRHPGSAWRSPLTAGGSPCREKPSFSFAGGVVMASMKFLASMHCMV